MLFLGENFSSSKPQKLFLQQQKMPFLAKTFPAENNAFLSDQIANLAAAGRMSTSAFCGEGIQSIWPIHPHYPLFFLQWYGMIVVKKKRKRGTHKFSKHLPCPPQNFPLSFFNDMISVRKEVHSNFQQQKKEIPKNCHPHWGFPREYPSCVLIQLQQRKWCSNNFIPERISPLLLL